MILLLFGLVDEPISSTKLNYNCSIKIFEIPHLGRISHN